MKTSQLRQFDEAKEVASKNTPNIFDTAKNEARSNTDQQSMMNALAKEKYGDTTPEVWNAPLRHLFSGYDGDKPQLEATADSAQDKQGGQDLEDAASSGAISPQKQVVHHKPRPKVQQVATGRTQSDVDLGRKPSSATYSYSSPTAKNNPAGTGIDDLNSVSAAGGGGSSTSSDAAYRPQQSIGKSWYAPGNMRKATVDPDEVDQFLDPKKVQALQPQKKLTTSFNEGAGPGEASVQGGTYGPRTATNPGSYFTGIKRKEEFKSMRNITRLSDFFKAGLAGEFGADEGSIGQDVEQIKKPPVNLGAGDAGSQMRTAQLAATKTPSFSVQAPVYTPVKTGSIYNRGMGRNSGNAVDKGIPAYVLGVYKSNVNFGDDEGLQTNVQTQDFSNQPMKTNVQTQDFSNQPMKINVRKPIRKPKPAFTQKDQDDILGATSMPASPTATAQSSVPSMSTGGFRPQPAQSTPGNSDDVDFNKVRSDMGLKPSPYTAKSLGSATHTLGQLIKAMSGGYDD